jgi:O-antigen/teichoic acid export membrane protein
MSLIGNSIAQVFFQRSAEAHAEGKLAPLVRGAFQRLVVFSLFPLLTLTFIGADFFGLVFGPAYTEAGVYTQILSVWTFFWFISSPLSTLFATLEKQELSLNLNLLILVTRFLSLFVGGLYHDPRLAIILFSASGVVTYGLMSFAILYYSAVPRSQITEILSHRLLEFLPAALVFTALLLLRANPWITTGVALLINGLYYLYYIWREPGVASFLKRIPGLKG